jgi:hypothetical protein
LASNNHYTLDETVLDMVFQRNAALAATQVAAEQQKKAADAKKTEGLQAALRKFDSCPNGLTAPKLRALVMAGSKSSDSPVKKKKQELQEQLYREPRYSRVKLLAEEVRRTLTFDAAETLATLFGNNTASTPSDPLTAV